MLANLPEDSGLTPRLMYKAYKHFKCRHYPKTALLKLDNVPLAWTKVPSPVAQHIPDLFKDTDCFYNKHCQNETMTEGELAFHISLML